MKYLGIEMVAASISSTIADGVVQNPTFLLQNTRDIVIVQLALARDDEVVLQLFVLENTPKPRQHSKRFTNVYIKNINLVQRFASRNVF